MIFHEESKSEGDCVDWLFRTRRPSGLGCPKCGGNRYWSISARELYKCAVCYHQIFLTVGTVFHKTRTQLMKWFMLIFRMATSKTGVSINGMQRELEIRDYKTIWAMAHKIRKAKADRNTKYTLAGLVEIDESFFGPSSHGKRGRGAEKKELVIVAVSTWKDQEDRERPGFAHALVAADASAETIENILMRLDISKEETIPLIEAIRSDGWRSYETVSKELGIAHHRAVLHNPQNAPNLLPWTHKVVANAKAVFAGPHRAVSRKHLQKYLSEVCYLFNRRFWNRETFHRLLYACASTTTITFDELMGIQER